MFGAKVIIMMMRLAKIKYFRSKVFKMIGILIPLLLPIILLEVVSFIPVILFAPLFLLGGILSESISSGSSTDMAVSLVGLVGLVYYLLRS